MTVRFPYMHFTYQSPKPINPHSKLQFNTETKHQQQGYSTLNHTQLPAGASINGAATHHYDQAAPCTKPRLLQHTCSQRSQCQKHIMHKPWLSKAASDGCVVDAFVS